MTYDYDVDIFAIDDVPPPPPRRRRRRRRLSLVLGAGLVCATLVAAGLFTMNRGSESPTVQQAPTAQTRPSSAPDGPETGSLPVKGRAPLTGYDRTLFGNAWADVDANGCDTRNDILRRDMTDVRIDADGCEVLEGRLQEPFSGDQVAFTPETSEDIHIDHVVSLANAWQTGAFRWSAQTRERFANDPANLLAVDGRLNMQKGDGDAATWLPPNKDFRCDYVSIQLQIKEKYDLWMTPAESSAIERILDTC